MNELIGVPMKNKAINTDAIDQKFRSDMAFLIPVIEGQPYLKSTTEATVNSMWKVTAALRPNKSRIPYEEIHTGKTDDGIHEDVMILVKDMANLMQKIVHSSSWRNGTFETFDKAAFAHQLNLMANAYRRNEE